MAYAVWQQFILDVAGNVMPGAAVEFRRESAGFPLQTLYVDRNGAQLAGNPVYADADGFVRVYLAGGAYKITATLGSRQAIFRHVAIGTAAENDLSTNIAVVGMPGVDYLWDTGTADADPGTGEVRANNATLSSATQLYISETDRLGNSLAAVLAQWDDPTSTVRGTLTIKSTDNPTRFVTYNVTGALTDAGDYDKLPVTYVGGPGGFEASEKLTLLLSRTGDKGDTGATGATGAAGADGADGDGIDGDGVLNLPEITEPTTPSAGTLKVYAASDHKLYKKDSDGTVEEVGSGGGGGITTHGDSDYTILASDRTVATSAALTAARAWTLPAASAFPPGQPLYIVDLAGGIAGSNTLTVQRAGSDTIDGSTSIVLRGAYAAIVLESDGSSKWKVVSARGTYKGTSYTSGSGTHTTMPGCTRLVAQCWGGGGGSSGSGTGAGAGGNGGNTTFGSVTGNGGTGGSRGDVSGVGGAGGSGSGGDLHITGQLGGGGQNSTSQPGGFGGGAGAIGIWTSGATPGATGVAGVANTAAGAGGGGSGTTAPAGGGGGGGGYAKKTILGPAASYSYAVGAGGSAGTAGTSGLAGNTGGSGLIFVEEFTD